MSALTVRQEKLSEKKNHLKWHRSNRGVCVGGEKRVRNGKNKVGAGAHDDIGGCSGPQLGTTLETGLAAGLGPLAFSRFQPLAISGSIPTSSPQQSHLPSRPVVYLVASCPGPQSSVVITGGAFFAHFRRLCMRCPYDSHRCIRFRNQLAALDFNSHRTMAL